ncbi:MAG TPA: glycine zipper 2TM domain-containing protein [Burkholderiales bacterium]|nr:glycine zipper 2TM domain-containing protein [Burkholderiales bacterium]
MNKIALCLLLATAALPAAAAPSNDAYRSAASAAETRYASDKKLCAAESSSATRMQCLRDAKAEHDKAMADARKIAAANGGCAECGTVLSVAQGERKGKGGPIGLIGGGVAGAVLGHQIGSGNGKTLATIAGAAGGAYGGHKIEEKVRSTKVWLVRVQMDSGQEKTFTFTHDPGFTKGDLVRESGKSIVRQ